MGLRVEVYDDSSDDDTYTLNDISDNVNDCCSDVHVIMAVAMVSMSMAVTVGVSSV